MPRHCQKKAEKPVSQPPYASQPTGASPFNFMNNTTNQKPVNTVYGSNLVNSNNTSNHSIQNQGIFINFGNIFNGNINLGQILGGSTSKPSIPQRPSLPRIPVQRPIERPVPRMPEYQIPEREEAPMSSPLNIIRALGGFSFNQILA